MEELMHILKKLHADVDFDTCEALVDDDILDSFDIISIIADIRTEFGVTIPAAKIVPENFNSARSMMALIEELENE